MPQEVLPNADNKSSNEDPGVVAKKENAYQLIKQLILVEDDSAKLKDFFKDNSDIATLEGSHTDKLAIIEAVFEEFPDLKDYINTQNKQSSEDQICKMLLERYKGLVSFSKTAQQPDPQKLKKNLELIKYFFDLGITDGEDSVLDILVKTYPENQSVLWYFLTGSYFGDFDKIEANSLPLEIKSTHNDETKSFSLIELASRHKNAKLLDAIFKNNPSKFKTPDIRTAIDLALKQKEETLALYLIASNLVPIDQLQDFVAKAIDDYINDKNAENFYTAIKKLRADTKNAHIGDYLLAYLISSNLKINKQIEADLRSEKPGYFKEFDSDHSYNELEFICSTLLPFKTMDFKFWDMAASSNFKSYARFFKRSNDHQIVEFMTIYFRHLAEKGDFAAFEFYFDSTKYKAIEGEDQVNNYPLPVVLYFLALDELKFGFVENLLKMKDEKNEILLDPKKYQKYDLLSSLTRRKFKKPESSRLLRMIKILKENGAEIKGDYTNCVFYSPLSNAIQQKQPQEILSELLPKQLCQHEAREINALIKKAEDDFPYINELLKLFEENNVNINISSAQCVAPIISELVFTDNPEALENTFSLMVRDEKDRFKNFYYCAEHVNKKILECPENLCSKIKKSVYESLTKLIDSKISELDKEVLGELAVAFAENKELFNKLMQNGAVIKPGNYLIELYQKINSKEVPVDKEVKETLYKSFRQYTDSNIIDSRTAAILSYLSLQYNSSIEEFELFLKSKPDFSSMFDAEPRQVSRAVSFRYLENLVATQNIEFFKLFYQYEKDLSEVSQENKDLFDKSIALRQILDWRNKFDQFSLEAVTYLIDNGLDLLSKDKVAVNGTLTLFEKLDILSLLEKVIGFSNLGNLQKIEFLDKLLKKENFPFDRILETDPKILESFLKVLESNIIVFKYLNENGFAKILESSFANHTKMSQNIVNDIGGSVYQYFNYYLIDNAAQEIINCVCQNRLTTLILNENYYSQDSFKQIAEAIKVNESITKLEIGFDTSSEAEIEQIVEVIRQNIHIKTFKLSVGRISEAASRKLYDALQNSPNLEEIELTTPSAILSDFLKSWKIQKQIEAEAKVLKTQNDKMDETHKRQLEEFNKSVNAKIATIDKSLSVPFPIKNEIEEIDSDEESPSSSFQPVETTSDEIKANEKMLDSFDMVKLDLSQTKQEVKGGANSSLSGNGTLSGGDDAVPSTRDDAQKTNSNNEKTQPPTSEIYRPKLITGQRSNLFIKRIFISIFTLGIAELVNLYAWYQLKNQNIDVDIAVPSEVPKNSAEGEYAYPSSSVYFSHYKEVTTQNQGSWQERIDNASDSFKSI